MRHEIKSDGTTVWVNGGSHGACLARFSPRGIDVHSQDTSHCLFCTHGATGEDDWKYFCDAVWQFHGILIGEQHRPQWLRGSNA